MFVRAWTDQEADESGFIVPDAAVHQHLIDMNYAKASEVKIFVINLKYVFTSLDTKN